ncbi:hypothetical protein MPSEU_000627100 [Mayamaea pseudoterrestris]|nr:hypothetical protein MPSEU_000627100 [Mayamaea pseudoterrestris]
MNIQQATKGKQQNFTSHHNLLVNYYKITMSTADMTTMDVEQANAGDSAVSNHRNRNIVVRLVLATCAVALIACAIGIPLARRNNHDSEEQEQVETTSESGGATSSSSSNLSYFGANVVQQYESKDELGADLQSAGYLLINQVVKRNTHVPGYDSAGYGQSNPYATSDSDNNTGGNTPEASTITNSDATRDSSSTTDYGTNNQEDGVEEGDLVVSDGNVTYAAYGDYIIAFRARTGEQVLELRMPFNKTTDDNWYGGPADTGMLIDSRIMMRMPSIRTLVVHEESKRLLVICDGLAPYNIAETKDAALPILFERYGTHLRLYDTNSLLAGNMEPLTTYDVNGNFNAVRVIDGNAHVMTTTGVDTNAYLIAPFERSNYANMTDDEFVAAVQTKADQAVADFTTKLLSEITLPSGVVPNLARISLYADESSVNDGKNEPIVAPMNLYAQITSFSMTGNTIDPTASGTFSSDYWARFYASTDTIVISTQGSKTIELLTRPDGMERHTSIEQTYFTSFTIDGVTTTPHSVGKVNGYLLNEYAMDVLEDELRVAVTVWNSTWVYDPNWQVDDTIIPVQEGGRRQLRRRRMQTTTETVAPEDDWMLPNDDVTQNFVIVLQMPGPSSEQPGEMQMVGQVQIGKPDETITAVRFFDSIGYAVTFEQTDPFYVLDLANGPSILGEVEITGFSSYLHPINDDNTLILAIGQEADDQGQVLGLQLTIFDMSSPSSPVVLFRHQIETSTNVGSYSDALWDFKAARYSAGHLILPMDMYPMYANATDIEAFHGFRTFAVDESGIIEECSINNDLGTSDANSCYCGGGLPRRSMIFDGNVVTMQSDVVMSTNMNSCQQQWQTIIDAGDSTNQDCCGGIW